MLAAPLAVAEDDEGPLPRDTTDASVIRGSIAFRTYCVLCHLVLIILLLLQAALSTGSAFRLVGRLEESNNNSNASMKLTQRLLSAAQELSNHARETVEATDDDARNKSVAAFNDSKARLGEVVDEISSTLSSDPSLQQAVSDGLSTFVVSGVCARSRPKRATRRCAAGSSWATS
jgi:hypothetical protein